MSNVRTQIGKVIGKSLNGYHSRVKPKIDELKFKEQYQGRIIDCMVGEVDNNYIETPLTDENVVKLEHSKEGVIKIPQIKGKTILIDADGNETDTPGEGCRLVSVGEEEDNKLIILSKNKNIVGKLTHSSINTGGSLNTSFNGKYRVRTDFIKLEDGVDYIVSTDGYINRFITFYYSEPNHESFTRQGSWTLINNNILTRNASDKYVILEFNINHDNNMTIDIDKCKVQLERGNRNTNYTEPKCHKTEILLNEPLRKLPNGVCDKLINNQLIRRVGKMVLNGSENWERMYYPPNENGTHIQFSVQNYFENKNVKRGFWSDKNLFICDIFPRADESLHWSGIGSIGVGGDDTTFMFTLSKNHELYTIIKDVSELKEWLLNNPITVLYELEEPIIEELPNGITLQGFDNTTMYIENSITPTVSYGYNAVIPYKQALKEQKEEVEINTLDIENNIIPYLMDMEYNLMLMEDN